MRKITATLPDKTFANGRNFSGEKELTAAYKLLAFVNGNFEEPVSVRCWMGRSSSASVVYASIWIYEHVLYTAGSGKAGGYGYHKHSAAIGAAIRSAGISLSESIDGIGESAIREAIYAIGRALGYSDESMTIVEV